MSKLPKSIITGRVGEQYSRSVALDVSDELQLFPGTVPSLVYKRPEEETIYPGTISFDSDTGVITWLIDSVITGVQGSDGAVQIFFTRSDDVHTIIGQSFIIRLVVLESLTEDEGEPPDPYDSWIASLTALGATTTANATAAAASATAAAASAASASESATAAETAQTNATASASQAQSSASSAFDSATIALRYKNDALSSKNAAEAAQAASEEAYANTFRYYSDTADYVAAANESKIKAQAAAATATNKAAEAEASAAASDSAAIAALDARDKILALDVRASTVNTGIATARFDTIDGVLTLLLEIPRGEKGDGVGDLEDRLKSGSLADADLHLGFYINSDGYLCQLVEEE